MADEAAPAFRDHGRDALVDQLDGLVEGLSAHGINVSPASRIVRYARTLEALGRKNEPTAEELDLLSHSYDEGAELIEVTDVLRGTPETPNWRNLFERIKGGEVRPTSRSDVARNTQLELLMGAALKAAGAVVAFEEPDVRARLEAYDVVVAAKRVSSAAKLEANIRKARDQIAGVGLPGMIAVDCTVLLPRYNVLHRVSSKADAIDLLDPNIRAGMAALTRRVTEWVQHNKKAARNVLALLAYARVRFIYPGPERMRFGTIRRMRAYEVVPSGQRVPQWLHDFVLRFNHIALASPAT
jgi:hypothetical protein